MATSRTAASRKGKSRGRIALLVPTFPKLSESFIANKFAALLARGWDVHVVCQGGPEETEPAGFLLTSEVARQVHVGWPHRPRWRALLLTPVAAVRCLVRRPAGTLRYLWYCSRSFGLDVLRRLYLDAELICLQPDLLHFEFGALAVGRIYLKQALGCRLSVSFRGYDLNYVGLEKANYYEEVWQSADAIHCLGEDLWRRARRRGCPPDKPNYLIPPAVDVGFFDPGKRDSRGVVGTPQNPLRLLSVGRLEWKKGYAHSLAAVALLRKEGFSVEFRLIGAGDYLEAVAFHRHQLGLAEVVKLEGARPPGVVREAMLWADVLVHAAVSEGFCNAVVEAQAMELPVVCSDADGLPENIEDGETGFIVARRDSEALASKVATLARDPQLRARMGRAGRRRILARFAFDDQVTALDKFYAEVLGKDGIQMKPRFAGAMRAS